MNYYVIYVPEDVQRLGIKGGSEFQVPVDIYRKHNREEMIRSELGLEPNEYWVC